MNAAILLCLAVLAAAAPSAVLAKALYGIEPSDEQRADIELWISQAVAKNGSPLAKSARSLDRHLGRSVRRHFNDPELRLHAS